MKGSLELLLAFWLLQVGCCSYVKFEEARGLFSDSLPHSISKRHTQDPAAPEGNSHIKTEAGAPHMNAISDGEDKASHINAISDGEGKASHDNDISDGEGKASHDNDISDEEEKDSLEMGTDYDFVLNLDEKADFDRLLTLLSRSGPAKHSDEAHVGVSSTFIDRHDELHEDFPRPENSVFDQITADHPELSSRSQDESSEVEDPEKKKLDAEQKKLEELYFKNFEMDELPRGKRMGALISASSVPSASISSILPSVFVFLKCYVLVTRMW